MDRFKLERGVATSRRRGSRNTRPPLPLTSPTSQKRRTNGKVDGQKGCRKLLAPLERTVDGVSPIRSHGVRFNLRGRAKNTQESCWNVVVRPDANERFNRGIRGSHCRKVATMRAEGEIVLYVRSNFVRKGTRTAFSLELRGILDIRREIRLCFGKTASITCAGAFSTLFSSLKATLRGLPPLE